MAVVFAVKRYRKRGYRHRQPHPEIDPEPTSFQPSTSTTNLPLNQDALHDWSPYSLLLEDTDSQTSDISPQPISLKSGLPPAAAHVPASSMAAASASQNTLSSKLPQSAGADTTAHIPVTHSTVMPTSAHLTQGNTEIVQGSPQSLLSGDANSHPNVISSPLVPPKSGTTQIPPSLVAAVETNQPSSLSPSSEPTEAERTANPMSACLTEEQSELVQSLIRHNIPLPAVVGVMEGMLRSEGQLGSGMGSGSRITQSDGSLGPDNPPDYDFV